MQSAFYPHVRIFQQEDNKLSAEPAKSKDSRNWLKAVEKHLRKGGNMEDIKLQIWLRGRRQYARDKAANMA